jgi:arylsulfatase
MGHLPTDVAPDVRARGYVIEAEVDVPEGAPAQGVLIAHGDATGGYSLYLQDGHLVHDLNVGGTHQILRSPAPVPPGRRTLSLRMDVGPLVLTPPLPGVGRVPVPSSRQATLLVDGIEVASAPLRFGFQTMVSWSGLDIGRDRGSPVSHYDAPFECTARLRRVTVTLQPPLALDGDALGRAEMARQ